MGVLPPGTFVNSQRLNLNSEDQSRFGVCVWIPVAYFGAHRGVGRQEPRGPVPARSPLHPPDWDYQ